MSPGPVFGPISSRRLRRSLGVDAVLHKTCTYDCTYCQLGLTTNKTALRMPYVSADAVKRALAQAFSRGVEADYITFSGSGEPTLNLHLGRMVRAAQSIADVPVAILTNGSLLWHEPVAAQVAAADLVIPSLDTARPETFAKLNRPYEGLGLDAVLGGLSAFAKAFDGTVWVEVMVVAGVNDTPVEVAALQEALKEIEADKVQLNTVVRPPSSSRVRPVGRSVLNEICEALGPRAEVIARSAAQTSGRRATRDVHKRIKACLSRRPCTLVDLAQSLSLHPNEVAKHVREMMESAAITAVSHGGRTFLRCRPAS